MSAKSGLVLPTPRIPQWLLTPSRYWRRRIPGNAWPTWLAGVHVADTQPSRSRLRVMASFATQFPSTPALPGRASGLSRRMACGHPNWAGYHPVAHRHAASAASPSAPTPAAVPEHVRQNECVVGQSNVMATTHPRAPAQRARVVEHAWARVAREALVADGQAVARPHHSPKRWRKTAVGLTSLCTEPRRMALMAHCAAMHWAPAAMHRCPRRWWSMLFAAV